MKKIYFNVQAKGGAGKSLLTYLLALKNEKNDEASYFIDLDSSVKSSLQQLKFIQGKKPARFAVMNLLDSKGKIDRQRLFENLQEISHKNYEIFFLDFGAPESDQLPALFSTDYSVNEFKQIETELGCQFIFNVIIAGGSAYQACTKYLQKIVDLVNGYFEVNIYANEGTFQNHPHLIEELKNYAAIDKDRIITVKEFADFDTTTIVHKNILQIIEEGKGIDAYQFIQRIKILKEIEKV